MEKIIKKTTDAKLTSSTIFHGVGRRKKCVARVWVRRGSGSIRVNGKGYTEYFDTKFDADNAVRALQVCSFDKEFDIKVNVLGGGKCGQADAVRLGIARALVDMDSELKSILRQNGLVTVDSRIKERKKYGQRGARRKFQFVKR